MQRILYKSIKFNHFFFYSNLLSLLRMSLTVPIYGALKRHNLFAFVGLLLFGVVTDFLDGLVARKRNEISELGKILDPLADKVIIALSSLALMSDYGLPKWLGLSIIGRDILIIIGSVFLSSKIQRVNPSNIVGKITVNIIAATLLSYVFDITILKPVFIKLSILFIVISLIGYIYDGIVKIMKSIPD